jgi:hypothetical protein
MRTNPVASADFRASFSHTGSLYVWAIFLGSLGVVLFAWWPRSDLAWHLRTATPPGTFAAVAIALFLLAGYLNARAGDGEYAPAETTTLADLVALTPVPVTAVVAGRLAAGAITVLFQLLLGLPFLLAALGVSGVSASILPAVAAVVASAAMAWRASGLALRLALPEHPVLRDVLLLAASIVYLAATFVAVPAANPLSALVDLAGGGSRTLSVAGASLPFFAVSAIIALLVFALAVVASLAALQTARKKAKDGNAHRRDGAGQQG